MMTEFYGFAAILESLQETAQGIRVVKSFTLEPFMRERQLQGDPELSRRRPTSCRGCNPAPAR